MASLSWLKIYDLYKEDPRLRLSLTFVNSDVVFYNSSFRPVVVTFQEFKDREEVLRKSGVLKGNNIHITEDMSR